MRQVCLKWGSQLGVIRSAKFATAYVNVPRIIPRAGNEHGSPPASAVETAKLPRQQVLNVCTISCSIMSLLGFTGCLLGGPLLQLAGSGIQSMAWESLSHLPSPLELAVAIAGGIFVTSSRFLCMAVWDDLKVSTNAANQQVLKTNPEMDATGILLLACFPGLSEELLFRGAAIGNLGGSYGAIVLVAMLFGYLHVSGPRNAASGVFATWAGIVYGVVYVFSGSVLAAGLAHCVGNTTSAAFWLQMQDQPHSNAVVSGFSPDGKAGNLHGNVHDK